jgi:hypothetical protein
MDLVNNLKSSSKQISKKIMRAGLAGIIALSPYISGVDKAEAQFCDKFERSYEIYVSEGGEDNCSWRDFRDGICGGEDLPLRTLEGVNYLVREFASITGCVGGNPCKCGFNINFGPGDFESNSPSGINFTYPMKISGSIDKEKGLVTKLGNQFLKMMPESILTIENVILDNSVVFFHTGGLGISFGEIKNSQIIDTQISLRENTEVTVEGNNFISNLKPGTSAISVRYGGSETPAELKVYGNTFEGFSTAIEIAPNVKIEQRSGNNTFIDCDQVIQHDGTGYVDLTGNFFFDYSDLNKFNPKSSPIESYRPQGILYLTREALESKLQGENASLVDVSGIHFVNPHDLAVNPVLQYFGMTNLQHHNATLENFGKGFIGYNHRGKIRTFYDVDGDGKSNEWELANGFDPYNPDEPMNEVPTTSPLGLLGIATSIGLAGVYALKKRDKRG